MMTRSPDPRPGEGMKAAWIGIVCPDDERDTVAEFFELFKAPWEFFEEDRSYAAVLSTAGHCPMTDARLIILSSSRTLNFDEELGLSAGPPVPSSFLDFSDSGVPIYGNMTSFIAGGTPGLRAKDTGQTVGVVVRTGAQTIWRLGYDLFQEVLGLLSRGQPATNAAIPTLDLHISMLRAWILGAGLPVVEIPPVPAHHNFACCLTHDVDFAGISRHRFDRAVAGFLLRATLASTVDVMKGTCSIKKLFANWKAAISLPAVYLGLRNDFWIQFDQYMEIEGDLASTFFFMPFKNRPGRDLKGRVDPSRASRYDIDDVRPHVRDLVASGCEIGLHGIDAWHDLQRGEEEIRRIAEASGRPCRGVRMHWLYFDRGSARLLDESGLAYDSTRGYNEAVGYWGGTLQVFRPPGARKLLELPLHVQDSALFYRRRMGLSEAEAFDRCLGLIKTGLAHGGVLVMNWHHRSLGPERLWGDFYRRILVEIRKNNAWFGTCDDVVQWFSKRRKVQYFRAGDPGAIDGAFGFEVKPPERDATPGLFLRITSPRAETNGFPELFKSSRLAGGRVVEVPLDDYFRR